MPSEFYIEARTTYRCKDASEYAELAPVFLECVEEVFSSPESLAVITRSTNDTLPLVELESQVTHVETLVLQCMLTLTSAEESGSPPTMLKGRLSEALKRIARSRGRFHISTVQMTRQPLD
jgi:hypothetical protein